MGLAGMYLIGDSQEAALNLPTGAYDVPVIVQDRQFNPDGTLNYSLSSSSIRTGFLGDTVLVNGAAQPFFKVGTHKYRLRLLNGSNARYYTFALSSGASITEIGNEAGLFSKPIAATSVTLPPAGRADVIVDFSAQPVGTSVVLKNTQGSGSTADVMRFDVANAVTDTSTLPTAMRSYTPRCARAMSPRAVRSTSPRTTPSGSSTTSAMTRPGSTPRSPSAPRSNGRSTTAPEKTTRSTCTTSTSKS